MYFCLGYGFCNYVQKTRNDCHSEPGCEAKCNRRTCSHGYLPPTVQWASGCPILPSIMVPAGPGEGAAPLGYSLVTFITANNFYQKLS